MICSCLVFNLILIIQEMPWITDLNFLEPISGDFFHSISGPKVLEYPAELKDESYVFKKNLHTFLAQQANLS